MGLKTKSEKKIQASQGTVNITSLLDVLTVLLFFMIKSMTLSDVTLNPPKGIRLPASYVEKNAEEAVILALSSKELIVDQKVLMKLKNKSWNPKDIAADKRTLRPLKKLLDAKVKKRDAFYKGVGDVKELPPNKLLIQADQDLPFGLIKFMLHTVASAGYNDYQFVVIPKS